MNSRTPLTLPLDDALSILNEYDFIVILGVTGITSFSKIMTHNLIEYLISGL